MAYMDKKRYKNPTIPSAGRQGTSQPKYDRMAPPPRAPMRAAASMRVASREPREGAPPIPQTRRAPEPETTAAGPVRRAPESQDIAARSAAVSGMMTPGTTLAPTTPAPVAAAPSLPTAPQVAPAFDPLYAKSAPPPGSETPGAEGGSEPGAYVPPPPTTPPGGPIETGPTALPPGTEGSEEPADFIVAPPPVTPGTGEGQAPDTALDEGIVGQTGDMLEGFVEPNTEGLVYVENFGYVTPEDAAAIKAEQDRRAEEEKKQAFLDEDPGTNIEGLIHDLANQAQDSAAQEAALAGKKSEYLEAVDRMAREGALRRMGSGGAFARGFGTVTGKYAREMNNAELKNKELEMNGLSTAISNYVNLHSAELDAETKQKLADWQVHTDKIAQFHAEVNNWMADSPADMLSAGGYSKLYGLFNELVLSGEINPDTGKAWTSADIMDKYYSYSYKKMWHNGLKADGTWDDSSLEGLEAQLMALKGDEREDVITAMIKDLTAMGGYEDYIAELLKGMRYNDEGEQTGWWWPPTGGVYND